MQQTYMNCDEGSEQRMKKVPFDHKREATGRDGARSARRRRVGRVELDRPGGGCAVLGLGSK